MVLKCSRRLWSLALLVGLVSFISGSTLADAPSTEVKPKEVHQLESKPNQTTVPGKAQGFQIGDFYASAPGCFGSCSTDGFSCGCSCYGTFGCCLSGCDACFADIGCGPAYI